MIKLTIEVTVEQMLQIGELLKDPVADTTLADKKPSTNEPVTVPKSVKGIKMPSLGRTQAQIDDFTTNEQIKFDAKSEEQLRKEERATERAEKKALKEAEEAKKLTAKQKAQDEINAIKEAELTAPTTEMPIKKPWEL